jgi:hypothetical protein
MIRIPYMKQLLQGCSNSKTSVVNHHRRSDVSTSMLKSRLSLQRRLYSESTRRCNVIPSWATYDPKLLGTMETPYAVQNIVHGVWQTTTTTTTTIKDSNDNDKILIPHPYNTDVPYPIFTVPNTTNIQPFVESLRQCPKTGLHNPFKNVERYIQYGDISRKVSVLFLFGGLLFPFQQFNYCKEY